MRFVDLADERIPTNGITLRCRYAGTGPAVLLLHGWCGSSHTWRKVAPLLASEYTVIVPDMRGNAIRTNQKVATMRAQRRPTFVAYSITLQ